MTDHTNFDPAESYMRESALTGLLNNILVF
jgi:hypothetical protein